MGTEATQPPKVPPPWFVHMAWRVHRALYRLSGGRFLWTTSNKRGWGALRLTTVGRKSGQERNVIIGYVEDGPNLVVLAMNGWQEAHPSWWLNLEAHPDAVVRLAGQHARPVRALPVAGEEATGDGEAEELGGALADAPGADAAVEERERVVLDHRGRAGELDRAVDDPRH